MTDMHEISEAFNCPIDSCDTAGIPDFNKPDPMFFFELIRVEGDYDYRGKFPSKPYMIKDER